uniref:EGF-like domain-containing protein n=1 Tax=Magallana gigas TaxID=29159 RepID=A0A8W8M708_MAGGI
MKTCAEFSLLLIIWISMLQSLFAEEGQTACIVGYLWDQTIKKCIPCSAGYYGENCEDKCAFPHFGLKCLSYCNCAKRFCHHFDGCKQLPEGVFEDIDKEQNQTLLHPTNTTDNKWILPVMLGIIGLAVVSFVLAMIYLYTHKPWKHQIDMRTS